MRSNPRLTVLREEDVSALAEIVAEVEQTQRALAAAQAAQTRALARAGAFAEAQATGSSAIVRDRDMALRGVAAEVAGAMRLSDRSVQRQIDTAHALVADYPVTLRLLEQGLVTRAHVDVVTDVGRRLPLEARPSFDDVAAEVCLDETPGRARAKLELIAERLHPRTLTERHRDALAERCVARSVLGNGMSELRAIHSTALIEGIYDRLTQQARSVVEARGPVADHAPGDKEDAGGSATTGEADAADARSMDEIRADVLADLLLTAAPTVDPTRDGDGAGGLGAIRAKVQVVIPVLSLIGRSDAPCDLVGHSPIDAATARLLAGNARTGWERVLTHPVTGIVMAVDSYTPSAGMKRFLRGRDRHCRWPGCRMPAVRCEVDHTHDHALGGTTELGNLGHLCQRHHSMKQFTAWRVRQLSGGVLEWTSPTGRIYSDEPPGYGVHFSPEDDLPDDLQVEWLNPGLEYKIRRTSWPPALTDSSEPPF
jgi:hypothetical protein